MEIPPEIEAKIVKEATEQLVKALITNHGKKVYLSKYEVGGLLNCSPTTVMASGLPRYDATGNGGSVRFFLSDVEAMMEERKVKAS